MNVNVYNKSGEKTGVMELPDSVFGLKWNADLVHQVVTGQAANRRPHVAHVKDRREVSGGGKKPWRQKGTGRSRHGSIRSPIWKGGGVTHGPLTEKVYKKKINRKMAKKALWTVFSAKARDNEIIVVDGMQLGESKTKVAAHFLKNLEKHKEFDRMQKGNGVLVVIPPKEEGMRRMFRNIPFAGIDEARNLDAYTVLQYKYMIVPKDAVETFK